MVTILKKFYKPILLFLLIPSTRIHRKTNQGKNVILMISNLYPCFINVHIFYHILNVKNIKVLEVHSLIEDDLL